MTTQLDAVNEVLEHIGEPSVSALQTGQSTIAGEAETILDRERKNVLRRGWFQNEESDLKLHFASVSLTGTISTGTFTLGERVTQATSNAVGIITSAYTVGATTYLICPLEGSADFNGANNITGSVSAASTNTISAVANPASGVIQVEQDVIRLVTETIDKWRKVSIRNMRLFDTNDSGADAVDIGFTFDTEIRVKLWRNLAISELTDALSDYVVKSASFRFQRFKRRGRIDDAMIKEELSVSRILAIQEEGDMRGSDMLNTPEARAIKGNRQRLQPTSSWLGW